MFVQLGGQSWFFASRHHHFEEKCMNLKLVVAIATFVAIPAFAHAQPENPPPKPTAADVQKVVQIINADKAKLQAYCDLGKLNDQMAAADQKKDTKTLVALSAQADGLAEKIGPEYIDLMDGLGDVDENSPLGKQVTAALDSLDKQCK
jgi:hypothetical protein